MSILDQVWVWYSENMNYFSIFLLMVIESSFIPFPSEIVIPPAVYVAGTMCGSLYVFDSYGISVFLIILSGTLGALVGAVINYYLALWIGRPLVYKFADSRVGSLLLLSSEKVAKAETYFNAHGKISTLIGRFIPAVRQLISIPAGLSRMPMSSFLIYTFIGAFLWNTVLGILGYVAHGQRELITKYSHELSIAIVAVGILAGTIFLIRKIRKPTLPNQDSNPDRQNQNL